LLHCHGVLVIAKKSTRWVDGGCLGELRFVAMPLDRGSRDRQDPGSVAKIPRGSLDYIARVSSENGEANNVPLFVVFVRTDLQLQDATGRSRQVSSEAARVEWRIRA
jgi:hypothetical protein